MAQVKQVGEKITARETRDKVNLETDIGVMSVFTDVDNFISSNFIRIGSIGVDSIYTQDEKTRLAGIAFGAERNVRSNWAQRDATQDNFIRNKATNTGNNANTTTQSSVINTINQRFTTTEILFSQFSLATRMYWLRLYSTGVNGLLGQVMVDTNKLISLTPSSVGTLATDSNSLRFSAGTPDGTSNATYYISRNNSQLLIASNLVRSSFNLRLQLTRTR